MARWCITIFRGRSFSLKESANSKFFSWFFYFFGAVHFFPMDLVPKVFGRAVLYSDGDEDGLWSDKKKSLTLVRDFRFLKGKGLLPLYYIVSRSVQSYLPNVVYCQTLWFVFVLLWLSTCFGLLNLKGTEQLSVNVSSLKFVLG